MPTFNQLVRKGRKAQETKSTAPALQKGYNAKKKTLTNHRREAFVQLFVQQHLRSLTQL